MLRSAFQNTTAHLIWNGITIQMHDDWTADVEVKTTDRKTSHQGVVGRGLDYIIAKISFKPVATSTNLAALIAALHPYNASDRGKRISEIAGGSDLTAVIQGKNGRSITFEAGFITKEPDLNFKTNADFFSNAEITCLLATDGDSATIADFIEEASSAYTEPTLDPLTIVSDRYSLAWGSTEPFDAIEVDEKGIVLSTNLQLKERMTDRDGLLDYTLEGKTASVKFTPVNLSSADFLDLIPMVGRGKLVGTFGQALTVTPDGVGSPVLACQRAVPNNPKAQFGMESLVGELTMQLERKFDTTLQELYAVTVSEA
jgi:hypothetical protein